ncbi:hypothetical protein AB4K01_16330 [Serratia fonticola]|uniref:hypothetical protein n=1 Tax=Serratia fonticola TaxID=47917 RepID=UPI0034C5F07F
MDILELLKMLNGHLNTITINLVSDKDWIDKLSVLSPMVIGLLALCFSYKMGRDNITSQKNNSLIQAKIEIATRLKYDWLNAIRDLSSQFTASAVLIMSHSFREKNILIQLQHYNAMGMAAGDSEIKELNANRIALYNDISEEKRKLGVLTHTLETYLDNGLHLEVFNIMKAISEVIFKEDLVAKSNEIEKLLFKFKSEMYGIINSEWKLILEEPLK